MNRNLWYVDIFSMNFITWVHLTRKSCIRSYGIFLYIQKDFFSYFFFLSIFYLNKLFSESMRTVLCCSSYTICNRNFWKGSRISSSFSIFKITFWCPATECMLSSNSLKTYTSIYKNATSAKVNITFYFRSQKSSTNRSTFWRNIWTQERATTKRSNFKQHNSPMLQMYNEQNCFLPSSYHSFFSFGVIVLLLMKCWFVLFFSSFKEIVC